MNVFAYAAKRLNEVVVELQSGFASGKYDVARWVFGDFRDDIDGREIGGVMVISIAEGAIEVATAEANENGWCSGPSAFALERVKDLVNQHRHRSAL